MKKLFLSLIALALPLFAGAQVTDIRTATLIHGSETTVYYGVDAFMNAYAAAAWEGDVIVLSSGSFNNATNITKSISIYGMGYETDTITGAEPTSIQNIIIAPNSAYNEYGEIIYVYPTVYLEGLLLSDSRTTWNNSCLKIKAGGDGIENLIVRKCNLTGSLSINTNTNNCRFIQCVIQGYLGYDGSINLNSGLFGFKHSQLNFENCWISCAYGGKIESTILYNHCIIKGNGTSGYAHYTNNIIGAQLAENCTAYNNIFTSSSIGTNITGENNWVNIVTSGIFEPNNGLIYSATNDFILRFPLKYVGIDGTQVGINGGSYPFNRLSSVPRILQSDIDLTTTEDKKLNVSIKVEAQTK